MLFVPSAVILKRILRRVKPSERPVASAQRDASVSADFLLLGFGSNRSSVALLQFNVTADGLAFYSSLIVLHRQVRFLPEAQSGV